MTPEQRLYCLSFRIMRRKGLSTCVARRHAHSLARSLSDPLNLPELMAKLPNYPWKRILAPSPPPPNTTTSPMW